MIAQYSVGTIAKAIKTNPALKNNFLFFFKLILTICFFFKALVQIEEYPKNTQTPQPYFFPSARFPNCRGAAGIQIPELNVPGILFLFRSPRVVDHEAPGAVCLTTQHIRGFCRQLHWFAV